MGKLVVVNRKRGLLFDDSTASGPGEGVRELGHKAGGFRE